MKTISSDLKAAIAAGKICNIFTISTADGSDVKRFTDHNESIEFDSETYTPAAGLQGSALRLDNAMEVSNQTMAIGTVHIPSDELKSGKWDDAIYEQAVISWANPSAGKLVKFKGRLGIHQWTDMVFRADAHNSVRKLSQQIVNVVSPMCRHNLYDINRPAGAIGFCSVDPAEFTVESEVTVILTAGLKIKIDSTSKEDGWATKGYLTWTSGANEGRTDIVKIHAVDDDSNIGESVEFLIPPTFPIQVGDEFELKAGCDKTRPTCKLKFNNVINFGGEPDLQPDVNTTYNTV